MSGINNLTLAKNLTEQVRLACSDLEAGQGEMLNRVTEVTGELVRWWFQQEYVETRDINFHEGQKQALLNTIYAHEVLGVKTLGELYSAVAPDVLLASDRAAQTVMTQKNAWPKYCMKMATGTGKTWVLQALMIWQVLNANRQPENTRFTKNFLMVAPGLIVYDRLLDAFMGKERSGQRNFEDSDLKKFEQLFIPETYRDEIFRFVQGAVCPKEDIGRKVTSGGLIAISNWHILSDEREELEADTVSAPGADRNPAEVLADLLPLMPGTNQGNDLNQLNRKFERGGILQYLKELPSLMVFNDEAHHIHDFKSEGEVSEVEWQKSLNLIAEAKGGQFFQVDFSATPYNQVGTGKNRKLTYFPHIIVDFDLKTAMRQGLVKALVLDKRKEIGALSDEELEFKAFRDENGNPCLAEGQRIMPRAGLAKLKKLESEFATIDPTRHPKMLVMCEDTSVTPLVNEFLRLEGLTDDEILRLDSSKKGELKESDWSVLHEKLFDMDAHKNPRVVVSVLMLREGFDVNNICVIVPLRATQAQILLEQTIGRGLRLMWRGDVYEEIKRDNRRLIKDGKSPESMIDILSIVEHPAFQQFYEELMEEGLAGEVDEEDDKKSSTGDLMSVALRDGYEQFDFHLPFILREKEEAFHTQEIDVLTLEAFTGFTLGQLKSLLGKGEKFISEDMQTSTRFGDYRVDGGVMSATGYNDYISRLVRRIGELLSQPLTSSSKIFANQSQFPYMHANKAQLAGWIDRYIRMALFGQLFNPFEDENWRVLLVDTVTEHIIKSVARKLIEAEEKQMDGDAEIAYRSLSEVQRIAVRETASVLVNKCIYARLPYPSRNGGLEKAFIEMANGDSWVSAFCKINEHKHDFIRLRYIKEDGLPGFYHPDFIVRTQTIVYMVETKAQEQLVHPNVKRKRRAALSWCERVNALSGEQRMGFQWKYVLLGEGLFYEWRDKGASMPELLDFASLRGADYLVQGKLNL